LWIADVPSRSIPFSRTWATYLASERERGWERNSSSPSIALYETTLFLCSPCSRLYDFSFNLTTVSLSPSLLFSLTLATMPLSPSLPFLSHPRYHFSLTLATISLSSLPPILSHPRHYFCFTLATISLSPSLRFLSHLRHDFSFTLATISLSPLLLFLSHLRLVSDTRRAKERENKWWYWTRDVWLKNKTLYFNFDFRP